MANNDRYGRDDRYSRGPDQDRDRFRGRDDDRGFLDRAGDEVRSWFGDNDAERRRERDGDGYHFDGRDDRYENRSDAGFRGTFGRGSTSGSDDYGRRNYGQSSSDYGRSSGADYGRSSGYGASSYNSDSNRDRGYGAFSQGSSSDRNDYGRSNSGYPTSYGRSNDRDDDRSGAYQSRSAPHHDDDYRSWRDRQMSAFDRDYEDYRRERQQRFHNEFDTWRQGRGGQTQQQAAENGTQWRTKIREHQEVLGSDGEHVGVVDHVDGDRIKLTKRDGDGQHHYIPLTSIQSVDNAVRLSQPADAAKRQWRTETGTSTGTQTTGAQASTTDNLASRPGK